MTTVGDVIWDQIGQAAPNCVGKSKKNKRPLFSSGPDFETLQL